MLIKFISKSILKSCKLYEPLKIIFNFFFNQNNFVYCLTEFYSLLFINLYLIYKKNFMWLSIKKGVWLIIKVDKIWVELIRYIEFLKNLIILKKIQKFLKYQKRNKLVITGTAKKWKKKIIGRCITNVWQLNWRLKGEITQTHWSLIKSLFSNKLNE